MSRRAEATLPVNADRVQLGQGSRPALPEVAPGLLPAPMTPSSPQETYCRKMPPSASFRRTAIWPRQRCRLGRHQQGTALTPASAAYPAVAGLEREGVEQVSLPGLVLADQAGDSRVNLDLPRIQDVSKSLYTKRHKIHRPPTLDLTRPIS